jgi:hypothetical protein
MPYSFDCRRSEAYRPLPWIFKVMGDCDCIFISHVVCADRVGSPLWLDFIEEVLDAWLRFDEAVFESTGPTAGWDAEGKEGCKRMSSLAGEPREKIYIGLRSYIIL